MRITKDDLSFEWERLSDGLLVHVHDEGGDVPDVDLLLTDWLATGATPTVEVVTIRRAKGLASRDVRVPLARYVEAFASSVAHMLALAGDDRRQRARTTRKRRLNTDEFLAEVVGIYDRAEAGDRLDAVKAVYPASNSQVYRWIREARARGLDETED
jgi:hypothetical protein